MAGITEGPQGPKGSRATMSNKAIESSTLNNCLLWMNQSDSKKQLYIASSSASDYLSINGACSVKATFTYMAKMATFTDADSKMISNFKML